MTKSDVRREVMASGSHHFDRKTMSFFGDTMANYGIVVHDDGIVELYRRRPVKHGLISSAYFDPSNGWARAYGDIHSSTYNRTGGEL